MRLMIPGGDLAALVVRVFWIGSVIAVAALLVRASTKATARYIRRRPDLHGAPARAASDYSTVTGYSTVTDLARLRG